MKVRVSYTAQVSDEYRRAIRRYHGRSGLATREEVKWWLENHGSSLDDDLMNDDSSDDTGELPSYKHLP